MRVILGFLGRYIGDGIVGKAEEVCCQTLGVFIGPLLGMAVG